MPHRWHDVFHAALTRTEVVGVQATVRAYLRREPTRAEMNAARRAVTSYAEAEPAIVYHVPVRGKWMLLLARAGVEVDAGVAERAVTRHIRAGRPRKPDSARLLATVERGVETACHAARQLAVADIDLSQAAETAELLRSALVELNDLHRRLTRTGGGTGR